MPTALFISPHLDDVAFSCGGTLLCLVDAGWRVVVCTVFTASVPDPQGFALRCQTDKGIASGVDYMALRRAEDEAYAVASGIQAIRHWNHREAPHRGYHSPAELFAGATRDDSCWESINLDLSSLLTEWEPGLVFAPQGLGNHVDHLQTIRALVETEQTANVLWYRDTPYAIRQPSAQPSEKLPGAGLSVVSVPFSGETLARKIGGCGLYASQIPFQFGGNEPLRLKLTGFHHSEAAAAHAEAPFAERFLGRAELASALPP